MCVCVYKLNVYVCMCNTCVDSQYMNVWDLRYAMSLATFAPPHVDRSSDGDGLEMIPPLEYNVPGLLQVGYTCVYVWGKWPFMYLAVCIRVLYHFKQTYAYC